MKRLSDIKGIEKLTKIEKTYFSVAAANAGVPFIKGRAGTAKTAICYSIANKLGLQLIDLRLSQIDELSVGVFPVVDEKDSTKDYRSFSFAIPDWALKANTKPTLILFEEGNRCRQAVQDAVLGILQERKIGNFEFNSDVYMIMTGNMGEEDGTQVSEFDLALKNRLVTFYHNLTIADWIDGYAKKNVIPQIISFLNAKPESFYVLPNKEDFSKVDSFATPRSWSHLSDNIKFTYGNNPTIDEVISYIETIGANFIGTTVIKFLNYLEENKNLSYKDILDEYNKHLSKINNLSRAQRSDLLESVKEVKLSTLTKKQLTNLSKFISSIPEDEQVAVLLDFLRRNKTLLTNKQTKKDDVVIEVIFKPFKLLINQKLLANESSEIATI
jgi:hypothetical protein